MVKQPELKFIHILNPDYTEKDEQDEKTL